jgi:hypothetical protein
MSESPHSEETEAILAMVRSSYERNDEGDDLYNALADAYSLDALRAAQEAAAAAGNDGRGSNIVTLILDTTVLIKETRDLKEKAHREAVERNRVYQMKDLDYMLDTLLSRESYNGRSLRDIERGLLKHIELTTDDEAFGAIKVFGWGVLRSPVSMWAERLCVDASKLVDNVAMAGLAARLVQSPVLFRPSVAGKTLPRCPPNRRSVNEEMTKLRQRYSSSDPDVKETDAHHPLCHSVVWLAWQHLFDETLGGNATVPVSLSPVTTNGPRTSFRSALSHEGLAGIDGVGQPELYLNGTEMLDDDDGHRPWRCGRRDEPKSTTKIADAALMSWLPRGSTAPLCAWDGVLLTIDFEPRLFEESKYKEDLVTSAESWEKYIRQTVFRALRSAA